jgi:hypothetical protein
MEQAEASLSVVPANGKAAQEDWTLTRFAYEAGISYGAIDERRQVRAWLGDFVEIHEIGWSIAREAMFAGRALEKVKAGSGWTDYVGYSAYVETHDPPEGYDKWITNALRTLAKRTPTGRAGRLPRTADDVAYIIAGLVKKPGAELATYALALLDEKLYGIGPVRAQPVALVGKAADAARRADGLMRKAFSTPEEPEAVACFLKARMLAANYDFTINPKTGER